MWKPTLAPDHQSSHVGNAVKHAQTTEEPNPAYCVNHVTHGTTQTVSASMHLSFLSLGGQNYHGSVVDVAYKQATYFTYVRPVVEYAATAWDPHTCKNINKIEMTQRRSARYVTGDFRRTSSVAAMLNKLQWPSLADRRLHTRLIMLYRIRYNLVDIDWQQHLQESRSRTRGHGSRFTVPRCTSQVYASSFSPRTAKDWNNLPADPADSPSLEAFKSLLRVTHQ